MGFVKHIFRGVLISVLLLVATKSYGYSNYYLNQVSIQEGLSQSFVKSIWRDHQGKLWVGTKNGLNSYDGMQMQNYFHHQNSKNGLLDNEIYFVTEDAAKQIWVGTRSGLVRYIAGKDVFEQVNFGDNISQFGYSNYLFVDDKVVFGSGRHIVVYNPQSDIGMQLPFNGDEQSLPLIYQMIPWENNKILLASRWKGAYFIDLNTGELKKVDFIPDQNILSVFMDSTQRLWVSVYQQGVKLYDKKGHLLQHYHSGNSSLSNDIVLTINSVEKQIWLGTDGGGIQVFNTESETFNALDGLPLAENTKALNSVTVIYRDEFSGVWLGTVNGGVYGIKKVYISSYSDAPLNNPQGMSSQAVLSLFEDEQGTVWIGTDGGGVNAYNPDTEKFLHFTLTNNKKVNAITGIDNDRLLINCFGEGLKLFHKPTGALTNILPNLVGEAFLPGKGFLGIGLKQLNANQILILEDSLQWYDTKKNQLNLIETKQLLAGEGELKMAGLADDKVYLYGKHGLYQLQMDSMQFSLLYQLPNNQIINTVRYGEQSKFWIAAASGFYVYDSKTKNLSEIKTEFSRAINCLVHGSEDNLWMGVGANLIRFNPQDNTFRYFGRSDGVMPNEYYPKSYLLSRNGDVYMGGVTGLVRIQRTLEMDSSLSQEIFVSDLYEDGAPINDKKQQIFNLKQTITLPSDYTSFYFRVIIKDADFFKERYYRYQVKGYTKEVIETSNSKIDLSLLPYGSYPVLIQYRQKDGLWSQPHELMEITVLAPFWRSDWFKLLILLSVFLVVMAIWFIIHKRQRHKIKLQLDKEEKVLNEKKLRFLINVSHEIRTPISLIYGPLEQLIKSGTVSGNSAQLLKVMQRQVNYLKNLIGQVLDLNRIDQGTEKIDIQSVDFNPWLQQTVADFDYELKSAKMEVLWDLDDSISVVQTDPNACKKVVYNFLVNALKYASQSKTLTWVSKKIAQDRIEVSLIDQGPGLPADSHQLFKRYYQGHNGSSGYGIGLAYTKTIIETLGGQIGAENARSNGARFYFQLPISNAAYQNTTFTTVLQSDNQDKTPDNEPQDKQREELFQNLTLLIVEDNQELSAYLESTFANSFKKIWLAKNGIEGLNIIRSKQPDMVVSDVMMPQMNGFEMCRQIKEDLTISHIPIILLTARHDEQGVKTGYKMGADGYLTKPFSIDVLSNAIFNLLMVRKRLQDKYRQTLSSSFAQIELTSSNADDQFLEKLNKLIIAELANPQLGVDMLVDRLAISRAALYTKVKSILGIGVSSYINDQRLNAAKHLLETSQLPVVEVAEKVGMVNQSYFSTLFKQYFGTTPSQYRNNQS